MYRVIIVSKILCFPLDITLFFSLQCQINLCYTHFIMHLHNYISTART